MKIYSILEEFNKTNSSNDKLLTMRKYKDNQELLRVMAMAFDKVRYSYGIRKFPNISPAISSSLTLSDALDFLEFQLATREVTGNSAIVELCNILQKLSQEDFLVIKRVLGRDLKINFGRTQILKVVPGLITKPPYQRCSTYSEKTIGRIRFPAFCQEKMDGLYVAITVDGNSISFTTRSGEELLLPKVAERMLLHDGVYLGELLVKGYEEDRAAGNGLINSDNKPEDLIYAVLWDYLSHIGYANGCPIPYQQRFRLLEKFPVKVVPYKIVSSLKEALEYTSEIMARGGEGTVLKDFSMPYKSHTSPLQLKLKLKIELDVRVIGLVPGNSGSKNENYFSAILFETDDKSIQGQVGVTSMPESTRDYIKSIEKDLIGMVMAIEGNTLSKARDSSSYAVAHPRYKELRFDKTETDDLERALDILEMAKELS